MQNENQVKNKCIYRHIKPNGEVFYIGIGNLDRPYKKWRSKFWKSVVNKYPNYEIDIMKKNLSIDEAKELEIILIDYYGRRDLGTGTLVNQTNGGDGVLCLSEATKLKIREKQIKMLLSKEELFYLYITENKSIKEISISLLITPKTLKKHLKYFNISKDKKLIYDNIKRNYNKNTVSGMAKKVIDTSTGKIYKSLRFASKEIGIAESTLRHQLLGTYTNNTTLKFLKDADN